jgi:hypothetical protein
MPKEGKVRRQKADDRRQNKKGRREEGWKGRSYLSSLALPELNHQKRRTGCIGRLGPIIAQNQPYKLLPVRCI